MIPGWFGPGGSARAGLYERVFDAVAVVGVGLGMAVAAWDRADIGDPTVAMPDLAVYLAAGRAWSAGLDPSISDTLLHFANGQVGGRFLYPSWTLPGFAALGGLDDTTATVLWKWLQLVGLGVGAAGWYAVAIPAGRVLALAGAVAAQAALWPMVGPGFLNGNVVWLETALLPWAIVASRASWPAAPVLGGFLATMSGSLKMQGLAYLPAVLRAGTGRAPWLGMGLAFLGIAALQVLWPQSWWMYRFGDFSHLGPQDWFNDSGFQAARAALGPGASEAAVGCAYALAVLVAIAPFVPGILRGRREDHWVGVAWLVAVFLVLPRRHVYDWAVLPGIAGALVAYCPAAVWVLLPGWRWAPSQEGLGPWWVGLAVWIGALQAAIEAYVRRYETGDIGSSV